MNSLHDPALVLPGLRTQTPRSSRRLRNAGDSASSPLTGKLPTWTIQAGGFDVIAVPNGQSDPADGRSAVFILARLKPADQLGQELSLRAVSVSMEPTDSAASGGHGVAAGDSLGWGDTRGLSASIVVGLNLKGDLRSWSRHMMHILGVENNATASRPHKLANYPLVTPFPSGKWNDTTINQVFPRWSFQPDQHVIRKGDTLDFVLVVKSSQIVNSSGSTKYLVGYADIRCTLALSIDHKRFSP